MNSTSQKNKKEKQADGDCFMTLKEIAEVEGLTVMQVRWIIFNAFKKIKKKHYIKIKKIKNNGGLYKII